MKINLMKEVVKIRAKTNEENKDMMERVNKTKSWFLKKKRIKVPSNMDRSSVTGTIFDWEMLSGKAFVRK